VAGCCECGDEPSGSCATELVVTEIYFNDAIMTMSVRMFSPLKLVKMGRNLQIVNNSKLGNETIITILVL
jgi:hypothetical protein